MDDFDVQITELVTNFVTELLQLIFGFLNGLFSSLAAVFGAE